VNKRPPELPNIEDATLRACLAPLMETMNANVESGASPGMPADQNPAISNDNPAPAAIHDPAGPAWPNTLTEWRSAAEDDFGVFRTVGVFLAMTDAELEAAVAEFPRQIDGTVARLARIKRRLLARYDTVTTAIAVLERAMAKGGKSRGE
jgi:hypothetical protein